MGCPDVSLLPSLAQALGVPVERLLAGELEEQDPDGGSMRQLKFYVCPQCVQISPERCEDFVSDGVSISV